MQPANMNNAADKQVATPPAPDNTTAIKAWRRRLTLVIVAVNIGFLSLVIAWDYPKWWININYERSPLTWFSSVQLLWLSLCSAAIAWLVFLLAERLQHHHEQRFVWPSIACAFCYLALDERFQFHERLREGIFKPHQIGTHLPGIGPGDFMPVLYALAGLAIAARLLVYFRGDRSTQAWMIAALLIAAIATAMDTLDLAVSSNEAFRKEQFLEEIGETMAQACFSVVWVRHLLRLCSKVRCVPR